MFTSEVLETLHANIGPDELDQALARARRAWPSLMLDDERYLLHLAERLSPLTVSTLQQAHLEDLYLACACLHRVPRALELFEETVLPRIDTVVRRYDADPHFVDEVRQTLRQRLFMPPERIAEYSGRGPLVAWLRTAAARTALNQLGPQQRERRAQTDELEALPFGAPDPALLLLQGRHHGAFRAAFRAALSELSVRDRNALKLNALDGVSLEKLGAMYGTDKSTVSRWLARAQNMLLEQTRLHLAAELALSSSQVESLIQALQSQLAPSLLNLLNE